MPSARLYRPILCVLPAALLLTVPWWTAAAEQPADTAARLERLSVEQVELQLQKIPEIDLLADAQALQKQCLAQAADLKSYSKGAPPALDLQRKRWQELGLTCQPESDRLLFRHEAKYLAQTAFALRSKSVVSLPNGSEALRLPTVKSLEGLRQALNVQGAQMPHHVTAALYQMVQAEADDSRAMLVEALATIDTNYSTCCLAERAVYDPAPTVRQAAVKALATRPRDEFRGLLLEGLRYPWVPAARHAAAALVALQDRDALPDLKKLLDKPDPNAVFTDADSKPVVREMVRVNHLRNCLLCHAPSHNRDDVVAAPMPVPGEPLPTLYYGSPRPVEPTPDSIFVRADVTYLRQDFSVTQRVAQPNKWPEQQRFDFLVRQRPATAEEIARKPAASYPQRDAVAFAIERLSAKP
jgi:hypothetical protein